MVIRASLANAWRRGKKCGFVVSWETVSAGFGETDFVLENGKLTCYDETMGKEFVKEVLAKLADGAKFK